MINTTKKLGRAMETLSKNGGKMTPVMQKTMKTKVVMPTMGSKIKKKLYDNLVTPSVKYNKIKKTNDDKMRSEAEAGLYN